MRRKFLALLVLFFAHSNSEAQNPAELLNNWSAKTPIEKVYLHTDRENYIAGETSWFKAYLYSDYQPDTISTVLYTELVNESGTLIGKNISPVLFGSSSGHLDLPDTLSTGFYVLRSYTSTMLNQQPDFIFKRRVLIYGKNNPAATAPPQERKIRMDFFPEGGNLVTGLSSTVAFKITDQQGYPVAAKGVIKNQKSEIVAEFSSYHDGMGMFDLKVNSGEQYFATITDDAAGTKYELPAQMANGIVLTVMPHPQGSFFEIQQQAGDANFEPAYMIGQLQHHVVFRQDFKAGSKELQGVINTQGLRSGIMQITVFNKAGAPLAERLCFVNNREYIQAAELITDTVNFSGKGRNRFTVLMKDTVKGNFSFSITDAAFNENEIREENIFTSLLLTSDIKGYVHNPAWYFLANNDSVNMAMDLVMMTNGWRRFKWTELVKASTPAKYKDPKYITLTGKVKLRGSQKAFAEKQLFVWMIMVDSTRTVQMTSTDKQGIFRLDSMVFYGNTRFLFSDTRGKKSDFIDVELASDSISRSFGLPLPEKQFFSKSVLFATGLAKYSNDYDEIRKAAGLMLGGVTVKARKKSPIQELEEKYASGMFSGMSEKTIDLVNTEEPMAHENIFEYLKSRVPGLTVMEPNITEASEPNGVDDGTSYRVYYRYSPSASSLGPMPMTLYLDEIESSASVIATLMSNQIAMIKIFSNFVGAAGNGAGGVLAIYTKKGTDITVTAGSYLARYNGFTVTKEFFVPDYSNNAERAKTDNRITLDWRPAILINNVNPKIPFTFNNSDRTKKFRLVMEGVTADGKLLMIEKIISSPKSGF